MSRKWTGVSMLKLWNLFIVNTRLVKFCCTRKLVHKQEDYADSHTHVHVYLLEYVSYTYSYTHTPTHSQVLVACGVNDPGKFIHQSILEQVRLHYFHVNLLLL